jgi:hypothetical protein
MRLPGKMRSVAFHASNRSQPAPMLVEPAVGASRGDVLHSFRRRRSERWREYQQYRKIIRVCLCPKLPVDHLGCTLNPGVMLAAELFDDQDGLGNVGGSGNTGSAGAVEGGPALAGSMAKASAERMPKACTAGLMQPPHPAAVASKTLLLLAESCLSSAWVIWGYL